MYCRNRSCSDITRIEHDDVTGVSGHDGTLSGACMRAHRCVHSQRLPICLATVSCRDFGKLANTRSAAARQRYLWSRQRLFAAADSCPAAQAFDDQTKSEFESHVGVDRFKRHSARLLRRNGFTRLL